MTINEEDKIIIPIKDFYVLVQECLKLWPEKIDVSEKRIFNNGGVNIPKLIEAHDKVESRILAYERKMNKFWFHEHWGVVDHAIYQMLHGQAKNKNWVRPKEITEKSLYHMIEKADNFSNVHITSTC